MWHLCCNASYNKIEWSRKPESFGLKVYFRNYFVINVIDSIKGSNLKFLL